jgi:hypothetical protein
MKLAPWTLKPQCGLHEPESVKNSGQCSPVAADDRFRNPDADDLPAGWR